MQLYSSDGRDIKGCASFKHRQFRISLSTTSRVPELRIFDTELNGFSDDVTLKILGCDSVAPTAENFARAINAIDAR